MKDTLRNNRDVTALSALLFPPITPFSLSLPPHLPTYLLVAPLQEVAPILVLYNVRQRILFIF